VPVIWGTISGEAPRSAEVEVHVADCGDDAAGTFA
jgi:hypothetical protein